MNMISTWQFEISTRKQYIFSWTCIEAVWQILSEEELKLYLQIENNLKTIYFKCAWPEWALPIVRLAAKGTLETRQSVSQSARQAAGVCDSKFWPGPSQRQGLWNLSNIVDVVVCWLESRFFLFLFLSMTWQRGIWWKGQTQAGPGRGPGSGEPHPLAKPLHEILRFGIFISSLCWAFV